MNRFARLLLGAALCTLLPACLSGDLTRVRTFTVIDAPVSEQLEIGRSTLEECLQQLGAPLDVYQYEDTGIVVSYGWFHSLNWGASLSIPIGDSSGSLNYSDQRDRMRGFILVFSEDYVLRDLRQGYLGQLGVISDVPAPPIED